MMDVQQAQCWSEARDLLRQLGDSERAQISQNQRTRLYRLAFALLAIGVCADRYGLAQGLDVEAQPIT